MPAIYVDESGNTGDAAGISGLRQQPSFALVGVGEPTAKEIFAEIISGIRGEFRLDSAELKGRSMDRHPRLPLRILERLQENRVPIFVEAMDKEYYIAGNIVSFVLGIARLPPAPGLKVVANAMADFVAETLGSSVIESYCGFAREPSFETFSNFAHAFCMGLREVKKELADSDQALIHATVSNIFEEESSGLLSRGSFASLERFLPPPDELSKGKRVAMLPHVPAFAHLYARINRFAPDGYHTQIIHDAQVQAEPALRACALALGTNVNSQLLEDFPQTGVARWKFPDGKLDLSFGDSKASAGIQIADVLARFVTRHLNKTLAKETVDGEFKNAVALLGTFDELTNGTGTNVFSSGDRVARFWKCGA